MRDDIRPVESAGATRSLQAVIGAQLTSLMRVRGVSAAPRERIGRIFELFTNDSLNRPAIPPFEGLSFINANGLPFQWVFNFNARATAWGFLCEAGRPGSAAPARLALTLRLVDEACEVLGIGRPRFLCDTVRRLTPQGHESWPLHWRSAAWVGVAIKDDVLSLKPYFNLTAGSSRDRWLKAGWVLHDLGRGDALAGLCALSSRCSANAWPAGLALDIRPDGEAGRVKIYFRSGEATPTWLAGWYDALGLEAHASSVRRLLDLLGQTGKTAYPASAFITSVEIHPDQSFSLKTDLAVTKWIASDVAIAERTKALLVSEECEPAQLTEMLHAIRATPTDRTRCTVFRFVGLGCEPDGSRHMNIYIEPPLGATASRPPRRRANARLPIRQSVERGLDALVVSQHDRHWRDFSLPVGASDAWVTAYTLAKLATIPREWLGARVTAINDALDWLLATRRTPNGGWGYNGSVPDDADSTAWAVIALRNWHRLVPAGALDFLRSCIVPAGVTTYPAGTSPAAGWAQSVPCVSAVALHAIAPSFATTRAVFLRAMADGRLPPAYWWASPIYTTTMLLRGFELTSALKLAWRDRIAKFRPAGSFERAMLIECRLRLDLSTTALARELLAEQNPDGGFPPSALLRLTRPEIAEPWAAIDAGPLFVDNNGVFTTATALAALTGHANLISTGIKELP